MRLVAMGASWGGLEAVRTIVGALPAGFPAPVVIALVMNFVVSPNPNLNFVEITGLRQVPLLGETVSVAVGTVMGAISACAIRRACSAICGRSSIRS